MHQWCADYRNQNLSARMKKSQNPHPERRRVRHPNSFWRVRMCLRLILFAEGLDVGFAVGVEEVFAALLPGGF